MTWMIIVTNVNFVHTNVWARSWDFGRKPHLLVCFCFFSIVVDFCWYFSCNWIGIHQDFGEHMTSAHHTNGPFFTHYFAGAVDFHEDQTCKKFNLIDAFNKKFVFMYMSHVKNPNVVFIIYLLGRKCDAEKYVIDFELKDGLRKVKFNELCYSDAADIKSLINDHRCFVLPKKLVESYAVGNRLDFRFVIKRKQDLALENSVKHRHLQSNILSGSSNSLAPQRQQFVPKFQLKSFQSESNLRLTAVRYDDNNNDGQTNIKSKKHYKRAPKK